MGSRAFGRILSVVTVAALAVVGVPTVASAGPPGDWSQLSANPADNGYPRGSILDEPTVARFGGDLQIVWRGQKSPSTASYYTAQVDAGGATVTPSTEIVSDWAALVENPRVFDFGGDRMLVFSGLRSTTSSDPYAKGAVYYAMSGDGTTWGLGVGSLSATQSAYASYGFDALADADAPLWAGNPGSTNGLTWHRGVSPSVPAPPGTDQQFLLSSCCAYEAAVARDTSSGAVYGSFFSNSNSGTEKGIWVGQIRPTSSGWTRAPGSYVDSNGATEASDPDQRIAMAGRAGGGVYLAYGSGPTTTSIQLWRVGAPRPLTVPSSSGARDVAMAAAPDGSLWLAWVTDDLGTVRVVHTNQTVTGFGAVGSIRAPGGYGDVWKTALDASGPVDLVVTAANAPGAFNVFHQQVVETLKVTASKKKVKPGSTFTVTVSVATGMVKKAKVKAFGSTYTTNKKGKVKVTVPGGTGKGKATITAKKKPYGNGKTKVKVT
jgi:hypothetical protein